MSRQSKAKSVNQFIQDEALEKASSTVTDSESETDGPIALIEPKKRKQTTATRAPKKSKTENGVKYEILEEAPPKASSSKEELKFPCKKGGLLFKIKFIFSHKMK